MFSQFSATHLVNTKKLISIMGWIFNAMYRVGQK